MKIITVTAVMKFKCDDDLDPEDFKDVIAEHTNSVPFTVIDHTEGLYHASKPNPYPNIEFEVSDDDD